MSNALQVRSCADIAPSAVEWLWEPYLARGRLAILDGDHGSGKSLVAVDLAARLSRGKPLPNGQSVEYLYNTLLLSAEDPAATVRPRVAAAGADLARVGVVDWAPDEPPQLPDCVPELKRLIQETKSHLLVLDPLSAFVPGHWREATTVCGRRSRHSASPRPKPGARCCSFAAPAGASGQTRCTAAAAAQAR